MITPEPPPTPASSSLPASPDPLPSGAGLLAVLETLLKNPGRLIQELHLGQRDAALLWPPLIALLCLGIYGAVVGTLSGGDQIWIAPAKIAAGTFFAALICLPSLYVFACLGGANMNLRLACGVIFGAVGLSSLLLIGFAPVAWIFSQSTDSVAFMGALHLILWTISIYFGLGFLRLMGTLPGLRGAGHLRVWGAIFILVCLQMMTSLRPIIGHAETLLPTEKKFFVTHWLETLREPATSEKPKQ